MKIFFLAVLIVFSFSLSTCTSDLYNPDVCFQENILPIFVSKCSMSGCHNSSNHEAHYDLTNYYGIMKGIVPKHPLQSELYNSIRGSNASMPPMNYPQLTGKELSYIKIWIKMGAKNSSNCSGCDTTQFSFNSRVKPIIDTWCVGCHNASNAGAGYDLSTYSGIVTSITDGRFLGSVQQTAGFSPMPKNTSALSSCDLTAIEKWIAEGYPNN